MDEEQLRRLIRQGRGTQLDWQPAAVEPHTLAPVLTALANTTHGGKVLIGLDGETVTGITETVDCVDGVLQAALLAQPRLLIPIPQTTQLDGKTLLVVDVPAGMPNVYALDGRYLIREGTQNVPLHPRDLRRLLIERGEISFETEAAQGGALTDLDWSKIRAYAARSGISAESETAMQTFLVRRGCLTEVASGLVPTNGGILLFGTDVQSKLRGADITAVRFAGDAMGDTFNRQDIIGTLPDQIRRAETFLRDHLRKGVALQATMERSETFEYPLEAARELVVNAVAHRDYSISGDGIRLYLFRDRMEITSPGLLPGPVTITNIADERFSRNPALVQVLADLGFIERLGYGVDRVIELMRQQSLRAPEFKETDGGFKVVLSNQPEMIKKAKTSPPPAPTSEPIATPEAVQQFLGDYREIVLNPRQEAALIYLKQSGTSRITNSELQRLYPDVHAETIRRDLSDLVTKNLLVKMGEKRGSYYVLRKEDAL
jgi:ATP-dependent DNA helicase RecG